MLEVTEKKATNESKKVFGEERLGAEASEEPHLAS